MKTINFIHIPKNAGTSMKDLIESEKHLNIRYNGHNANVGSLENQMIIIRDPYTRFCSAVQYAMEVYGDAPKVKRIIDAGLTTPNDWAEAWSDETHKYHHLIIHEITNHVHVVDGLKIPLKWTYAPQHYWINPDKICYIIPYENIDSYFMNHFGIHVPSENVSKKNTNLTLSDKSKKFLDIIYKKDFEFIKHYSP